MAKDSKFGTFGGVYTPSVLTILGVIMYLRLPWIVGNAGLGVALGIIVVAHVVSTCTGLSIASIATDKNVGAGGPYYIVSRSLGLPIGGTLGLALFLGLAFSISLYVIGFSESLLRTLELEPSVTNIRICGSVTLLLLTAITLVSTAFAIKTQYLIFVLIGLSLLSIFLGGNQPPQAAAIAQAEGSESIAGLFAIFFPAVTGFTAGVNMSGDLRDPKRSIPKGTMLAIGTGFVVYVGLSVFVSYRVDRELLLHDPDVLRTIGRFGSLVVAGIWGATLSSALGSILGAPRILQAVSADRILPQLFARGYGKNNEPRNALVLALLIGWSGIMIAELDAIARVVSMVFLTTYGFLNLSCAIESWASPDFRPAFKINRTWSVLGATTCVVVMIQLDIAAMAGSTLLMAGLYAWLQRRELKLDSGDTWEGFWSSLVRSGLHRLSRQTRQHRNWRPNVLLFRADRKRDTPLARFAHSLVSGNGMLTDFLVSPPDGPVPVQDIRSPGSASGKGSSEDDAPVGVFERQLNSDGTEDAILQACRYHGFGGLTPNTVLLNWNEYKGKTANLARVLDELTALDFNQLLFAASHGESEPIGTTRRSSTRRIDIWWSADAGNLALDLAMVRFISASDGYRDAKLRFLLVSDDTSNNDILRTRTRRALAEARVSAEVTLINNTLARRSLSDWVLSESRDAALVLIGLGDDVLAAGTRALSRLETLRDELQSVLLMKGSSVFEEILRVGRAASPSLLPSSTEQVQRIGDLELPDNPEIKRHVLELSEHYQAAVSALHAHCIARLYDPRIQLLRNIRTATERQFAQLARGLSSGNLRKQRKLINRVQSGMLLETQRLLEQFKEHSLPEQRATLDGRIDAFLQDERLLTTGPHQVLQVFGTKQQFKAAKDDSARTRRLKGRRRLVAFLTRKEPSYFAPVGDLERYYLNRLRCDVLIHAVERLTADSHQLAAHLGKLLNSAEASLTLLGGLQGHEDLGSFLAEQERRTLEHFDDLITHAKRHADAIRSDTLNRARQCLQGLASDLGRIDVLQLTRKERRYDKGDGDLESLHEAPSHWFESQRLLLERAVLGLQVSSFQHRLATVVLREREQLELELKSGLLSTFERFLAELEELQQQLQQHELSVDVGRNRPELHFEQKTAVDVAALVERMDTEASACAQDLPLSIQTLKNETIEQLEERGTGAPELLELSVRPLILFVVESELIAVIQEHIRQLPALEQRGLAVGQDVARLIGFQLHDSETGEAVSNEGFSAHMLPAVESGIERLKAEHSKLKEHMTKLLELFGHQLSQVLTRTNVYELAGSADFLDQSLRLERGRRAVTGFRGGFARLKETLRRASIAGLYRTSAGLLLARKLSRHQAPDANTVSQIRQFIGDNSPRPSVLERLPFFYRQLFFGQSTLNETFWVPRDQEMRKVRSALRQFKQGARGALVICGERGSGKSALWQRAVGRLDKGTVFRVRPAAGGSVEPAVFKRALADAIGHRGSLAELMQALPPESVLVLDDFELWWERSPLGLAVVDLVLALVDEFSDRCLFLLCLNRQAFHFISRLRPLGDRALSVVECDAMGAEELKRVVQLRHDSTGLRYTLDAREEDQLSQWAIARLFASHFHYSRGLVGPALQSWITHIKETDKEHISLRQPALARADALDELRVEHTALLVQLALHRQLELGRVSRLLPGHRRSTNEQLTALIRMGLVVEPRPQIYELNRFVQHLIVERFQHRGLLR